MTVKMQPIPPAIIVRNRNVNPNAKSNSTLMVALLSSKVIGAKIRVPINPMIATFPQQQTASLTTLLFSVFTNAGKKTAYSTTAATKINDMTFKMNSYVKTLRRLSRNAARPARKAIKTTTKQSLMEVFMKILLSVGITSTVAYVSSMHPPRQMHEKIRKS